MRLLQESCTVRVGIRVPERPIRILKLVIDIRNDKKKQALPKRTYAVRACGGGLSQHFLKCHRVIVGSYGMLYRSRSQQTIIGATSVTIADIELF